MRCARDAIAEWFLPYLDGLALDLVLAGPGAPVGIITARAVRRLHTALVGAPPTSQGSLE